MATTHEWDGVVEALDVLEVHRVLHATLIAMRKLVDMVKDDPAFTDVHPVVSHAAMMFSRGEGSRRVRVEWDEADGVYAVFFVDPIMELSGRASARKDAVVRVLREYLDELDGRT